MMQPARIRRSFAVLVLATAACSGNTVERAGDYIVQPAGLPPDNVIPLPAGIPPDTVSALPAGIPPDNLIALPAGIPADNLIETPLLAQRTVEVRAVDAERQLLQVVLPDGALAAVHYDQNTIVMYRNQQQPVVLLERGDIVLMALLTLNGSLHAGRIDVQQTVQDRRGQRGADSAALLQLSGIVTQIDHERRTFVVRTSVGTATIALPPYPSQATRAQFHRLRVGSDVRLDATAAGTGYFEIYRFR